MQSALTRWTIPEKMARNAKNCETFNPVSGYVKYLEAIADRRRGEKPNMAMLVPDATPM